MEEIIQVLRGMGFSETVAEALAEREVTPEQAEKLDAYDILDHYLQWNGIGGFTGMIMRAVDNAREMAAKHGQS